MAIDSRQKRASLVGILPFMPVGVTPDATPDQAWRQAAGWGYYGILADDGSIFLDATAGLLTFSAPAPVTGVAGVAAIGAGVQTLTFTAPAAGVLITMFLEAGVQTITYTAPAPAISVVGTAVLLADGQTILFSAPVAAISGGAQPEQGGVSAWTGFSGRDEFGQKN